LSFSCDLTDFDPPEKTWLRNQQQRGQQASFDGQRSSFGGGGRKQETKHKQSQNININKNDLVRLLRFRNINRNNDSVRLEGLKN
jgi:hypothetical protein